MPKKHTPTYQNTKPRPVSHVSLLTSRPQSGFEDARLQSVNARLAQLRASQRNAVKSSEPLVEPLRPAELSTRPIRRNGRIAGPPPPRSWSDYRVNNGLQASRHAPNLSHDEVEPRAVYDKVPILPEQPLPEKRSLRALALKTLARTLSQQIEAKPWLVYELTARMKCELAATMMTQLRSSTDKLHQDTLEYLFGPIQDEDGSWASGGEGVSHLLLGPMMKSKPDYHALARNLRIIPPSEQDTVPDSWDDSNSVEIRARYEVKSTVVEQEIAQSPSPEDTSWTVPRAMWIPLLPSLTHLSLARPALVSWTSLLEIGALECLAHLTHLDLSYWPEPRLQSTNHEQKIAPLQWTGANYNPRIDIAIERIRILNRLGKACRKLTWLGLEGCEDWSACVGETYQTQTPRVRSRFDIDDGGHKHGLIRMDWTGVWRGLKSIKVLQAWVPTAFAFSYGLIEGSHTTTPPPPNTSVEDWWEEERRIRFREITIAGWRLEAGQQAVKFEKTPIQPWLEEEIRAGNTALLGASRRHLSHIPRLQLPG